MHTLKFAWKLVVLRSAITVFVARALQNAYLFNVIHAIYPVFPLNLIKIKSIEKLANFCLNILTRVSHLFLAGAI